jgi:hypothetical protein
MTPENKTNLLGFIIYMLIVVVGVLGLLLASPHVPAKATDSPVETIKEIKVPMSVRELQTFLNEAGHPRYACKIDGKMGGETQRAWDNYICDQYAKREFKRIER